MTDWLALPVGWMALLIFGAVYLFTAAVYLIITRLAVNERLTSFKAISAGMLSPLAIVFALLVGFLAAQVWSDGQQASAAVNREASALRSVVLLAAGFPGEPERRFRELVASHIQEAATNEWPEMASGNANLRLAPHALANALRYALTLSPQTPGQMAAQREIVASLESAFDARRQRIILSHSTVNWVKWSALLIQAGLTLIVIGMVHSDNRLANRIILAVFATGVAAAVTLIAAHSRPFSGEISVTPAVLLQVMPEAGAKAGP